jgi:hypothetical protein
MKYLSPISTVNNSNYEYIHKSFYEYYIAQSIIEETLKARCQPIKESTTMISSAYLSFGLDIVVLISEHVMELPLDV